VIQICGSEAQIFSVIYLENLTKLMNGSDEDERHMCTVKLMHHACFTIFI